MSERKRPTMNEVAREAGVSKATVSRVLAGLDGMCTVETNRTVRAVAERLGYIGNSVAASLRSRRTRTVGLVIADVSNPFFGNIALGVESRLAQSSYSVLLANTGNLLERERALVRLLVERQIDGIIAAPSGAESDHFKFAQDHGVTIVLVDSEIDDLAADCVMIDNQAAASLAVNHLIIQGHRHIAIVTGPLDASFDRHRLDGYRLSLSANGLPYRDDYVIRENLLSSGGEDAVKRLCRLRERPTAIFSTNNMMTLGLLIGLKKQNIAVPDEISLLGFDDQDWYSVSQPSISGIVNPAQEIGCKAADRLLLRLQRKVQPRPQQILFQAALMKRQSVGPPAEAASASIHARAGSPIGSGV